MSADEKQKRNYFDSDGNLITELRTMFRQVGWIGQSGAFYVLGEDPEVIKIFEPGSFSPMYIEIAVDKGEGWED